MAGYIVIDKIIRKIERIPNLLSVWIARVFFVTVHISDDKLRSYTTVFCSRPHVANQPGFSGRPLAMDRYQPKRYVVHSPKKVYLIAVFNGVEQKRMFLFSVSGSAPALNNFLYPKCRYRMIAKFSA